jgi:hypothetical protein
VLGVCGALLHASGGGWDILYLVGLWLGWAADCCCITAFAASSMSLLLSIDRLFGVSVGRHLETKAEAKDRGSQILKLKPKTKKTKILVRFGAVRFGFRYKCAHSDLLEYNFPSRYSCNPT